MNRPPEFDLEFSSESCLCGCRGEAALHEAFESGLSGEAWRQRRPSRPAPGGPGSGPRPPARRPGPRHRPGPFRPGIIPLYEPYAAGPGPEAGTEHTRWVQDCLNRIFSLQLPVDGILDAAVRSALRRLQQQERLPAIGIVSPATERALQRRCGKAGEPNEQEWESEVSRSSPAYIRWVQSSLNKILGLRLAVDGIIGPMTRSAIRTFQQRQYGLKVDGIVGPMTEQALIRSGASSPAPLSAPQPVAPPPALPQAPVSPLAARFQATPPFVGAPLVKVAVARFVADREYSGLSALREYLRDNPNVPEDKFKEFSAGTIPHRPTIQVLANHVGGSAYSAQITLNWDPNSDIVFDTVQPDTPVVTTEDQLGMTIGEHERIYHAEYLRQIMTSDFINNMLAGKLRLTARAQNQVTKTTEPVNFAGPVIAFLPITFPATFNVVLQGGPNAVLAGERIKAELDRTLLPYIFNVMKYATILMSHGPQYDVPGETPYAVDQAGRYRVAQPPAPPSIKSRL